MNILKKIGKALFFPHMVILWLLFPIATVLLVYGMTVLGTQHPISIGAYGLSAYTLTIWCCRIPRIIRFFKHLPENRYLQLWNSNPQRKANVSLFGGFAWNGVYGLLQLGMAFWHHSYWFGSLACYYFLLGLLRLYLALYTRNHRPGEDMITELKKYRTCGIIFFLMNLALALMVFFMVYWNRTFRHHPITTIAMAAYTFTSLTLAVVDAIRYRKLTSPVLSASKFISLAAACVSMLTLEATMLTVFGAETMDLFSRRLLLALTGAGISAIIIAMAIYMILKANRQLKKGDTHG